MCYTRFSVIGRLTWLVYIIGAVIGGRVSFASTDEHDEMDGELVCRWVSVVKYFCVYFYQPTIVRPTLFIVFLHNSADILSELEFTLKLFAELYFCYITAAVNDDLQVAIIISNYRSNTWHCKLIIPRIGVIYVGNNSK